MSRRPHPEEVFTPRSAQVNPDMYVDRPDLEEALLKALRGHRHIIIHGDSGTGKSWLYKRVLAETGYDFEVLNLARLNRKDSLDSAFEDILERREVRAEKTGFTESKHAEVAAPLVAKGGLDHTGTYELARKDPFERVLKALASDARRGRRACLVLDNLEQILNNPEKMRELASLIILADDEQYAQYGVKILIVGVPREIKQFFAQVDETDTIANRLVELPEVARLGHEQARSFAHRGLIEALEYRTPDGDTAHLLAHISHVTDRIPQYLHEYCLILSYIAEDSHRVLKLDDAKTADAEFLATSLESALATVEANLNSRRTQAGRRNQTIYAVGHSDAEYFDYVDVEAWVRMEFESSTSAKTLNVSGMLSELSKAEHPLLVQTPKGNAYRFRNPKYRMAIRALLRKTEDGERVGRADEVALPDG